jgi:hypothetical protein
MSMKNFNRLTQLFDKLTQLHSDCQGSHDIYESMIKLILAKNHKDFALRIAEIAIKEAIEKSPK